MSATSADSTVSAKRMFALRGNSFGAVVMLLVQYGLGMWVNLYAVIPKSDKGSNIATGVVRAITNGPLVLTLHAILGIALTLMASFAVVRAAGIGRMVTVAVAVGLLAILLAALTGARFVGTGDNSASFVMALATAVAIFCYAFVLLVTGFAQSDATST